MLFFIKSRLILAAFLSLKFNLEMQDNIINKIYVCIFVYCWKNLNDTQDETLPFSHQMVWKCNWICRALPLILISVTFQIIEWRSSCDTFPLSILHTWIICPSGGVFLSLFFLVSVFFQTSIIINNDNYVIRKMSCFRYWYVFFFCITCKILFTVFPRGFIKHDSILY